MKKKAFIIASLCALSLLTWQVQAQDYTRDSLIMSITGPDGDTNVAFNFPTFLEMRGPYAFDPFVLEVTN